MYFYVVVFGLRCGLVGKYTAFNRIPQNLSDFSQIFRLLFAFFNIS